jgi:GntR family transcriptional regulator
MTYKWNDNQPIYWQLRERTIALILDGTLKEGDPLPSVRQVAAEFQLNPITVSKAYQALVDEEIVEKRRGLGMFVKVAAQKQLLETERKKFLTEELPGLLGRIKQLGLDFEQLIRDSKKDES